MRMKTMAWPARVVVACLLLSPVVLSGTVPAVAEAAEPTSEQMAALDCGAWAMWRHVHQPEHDLAHVAPALQQPERRLPLPRHVKGVQRQPMRLATPEPR